MKKFMLKNFFSWFTCPICYSIPVEESAVEVIPYEKKYIERYKVCKKLYFDKKKEENKEEDKEGEDKDKDSKCNFDNCILYESTPRGNIIMKYNEKEEYFYYYSDSKDFPYLILESVAHKFVIYFHCFEIFKEMDKELEDVEEIKQLLNDKYSKSLAPNKLKETQDKVIKRHINKYVYQGKICEFLFLQKKSIRDETNVAEFSYSDFLKLKSK
tara:strand:+ start:3729 stop:4367 length:639 start_codon:yes stop_codon:yes gene_type:complete